MHRPTLMSLVRILYLHIECFSICAVRRLAGARYFCMAILCYEIPCCFFFHSGWLLFFASSHFIFLICLMCTCVFCVWFFFFLFDYSTWAQFCKSVSVGLVYILSFAIQYYFHLLKIHHRETGNQRERNIYIRGCCFFSSQITVNAIKIHFGLLNFNLFFCQWASSLKSSSQFQPCIYSYLGSTFETLFNASCTQCAMRLLNS